MKKYIVKVAQAFKNGWKWYKNLYQGRKWYTKTAVGFVSLIVMFLLYLVMVDINFLWLFGKSPSMNAIMHPKTIQASELYSADGVQIGKYFSAHTSDLRGSEPRLLACTHRYGG